MSIQWDFDSDLDNNLNPEDDNLISQVQPEDLLSYGLIPELIGRLPILAPLHNLTEDALKEILTKPKNAIVKQYKKLFMMEGIDLEFDEMSLAEIVKLAMERKTGARALRSIVENILLDIMYEIPDKDNIEKCLVTVRYRNKKSGTDLYRS